MGRGAWIWRARRHGLLHRVIDVEDHALDAVFAVRLLVLAFDDGEGLQHGVHVVAPDAVAVGGSSLRWQGVAFNIQERVMLKPMWTA